MNIAFLPEGLRGVLSAQKPYSPGFEGRVCYETAGIIAPTGDLDHQILSALDSAHANVVDAGYSIRDVVRVEIWMVGMNAETTNLLNQIYLHFLIMAGEQFSLDTGVIYPARQAIGVAALPHPDALFEVVFKVAVLNE